jgi:hypothetical protein
VFPSWPYSKFNEFVCYTGQSFSAFLVKLQLSYGHYFIRFKQNIAKFKQLVVLLATEPLSISQIDTIDLFDEGHDSVIIKKELWGIYEMAAITVYLNRDIQFGIDGKADRIKESFYLELWTLLEAGADIRIGLELIINEQKKKKSRIIFEDILPGLT